MRRLRFRSRAVRAGLIALTSLLASGAGHLDPPPALPAPDPAVAVPRHVARAGERIAGIAARDDIGRRALAEARASLAGAQLAAGRGGFLCADQLAASADDLIRAVDDPRRPLDSPPPPAPDATLVLANVDVVVAALSGVDLPRVRSLLGFAQSVAARARREAALDRSGAGRDAGRAEAIARAAAHVAIAADPTLGPLVPPPPPRRGAPPPPPPAGEPHR